MSDERKSYRFIQTAYTFSSNFPSTKTTVFDSKLHEGLIPISSTSSSAMASVNRSNWVAPAFFFTRNNESSLVSLAITDECVDISIDGRSRVDLLRLL